MPNKLKGLLIVLVQLLAAGYIIATGPILPTGIMARTGLLFALGLGAWAILTMKPGRFNIVPDVKTDARLVTRGPYRFVRHPMYTSLLLFTLVLLVNSFSVARLLAWTLLLLDIVLKILYEEKLLLTHFDQYAGYTKETKRLIPFLF